MPELPEAETIVRDLQDRVAGARVTAVRVIWEDVLAPGLSPHKLRHSLRNRQIEGVSRRGKNVVLEFEGDLRLIINLGMTGRVISSRSPRAVELQHIAVRLALADGSALLYDDARRFGCLDLRDADGWRARNAELGVEPLSADFTARRMHEITRKSTTPIRNLLLDQKRIAGIGNIYANEALFRARVRPRRRARRLTRSETRALRDALRVVLREAIAARGTTFSDYRDGEGESGAFEPKLRVYGRDGLPCTVCRTPIKRIVLTNRSAFYCPRCQR
jgi:formamidopyrimidine-DNA glycosylase